MKRFWKKFKNFWKGIWNVVKSMGNWKGVVSLLITWLTISGAGLIILGYILAIPKLKIIGVSIYAFWLAPFTPLMAITIGIAMIIQKYVFRDKNVSWQNIKERFKEAYNEENKKE